MADLPRLVNPRVPRPGRWFTDCMPHLDADLLEITPLSSSEWRVCDGRLPATDARRLIARVERAPHYVMVHWVAPHQGWAAFPSFEAALRALRLTCAARPLAAA